MKIKVWDPLTRLFHWSLVVAYIVVVFTSHEESLLEYHVYTGYLILGFVIFRVLWGFAGNQYARFSGFVRGWAEVRCFLKQVLGFKIPRYIGHNPAVGWYVLLMLGITIVITATGIITYGGEENRGIFAGLFPFGMAMYSEVAHRWLTYAVIALIVGHICAALIHDFVLKENIILSMITGVKEDMESWSERVGHLAPEEGRSGPKLVVYMLLAVFGGLAMIYLPLPDKSDPASIRQPRLIDESGGVRELVIDNVWQQECADCHIAFHPTLMSAVSWKRIMDGLNGHFGEIVEIDGTRREEIEAFLSSSSAERSTTEVSRKIIYFTDAAQPAPLRITDSPYWQDKHADIKADVYKRKAVVSKSNCTACHPWAASGSFEDRDISIPE